MVEPLPDIARLSRRSLLAAGLGIAAAGCAARRISPATTKARSSSTATPQLPPFAVITFQSPVGDPAKAIAGLKAFAPGVDWVNYMVGTAGGKQSVTPGGRLPQWGVAVETPFQPPRTFVSLEPALKRANFNPAELVPGALAAFTDPSGAVFGLPVSVQPQAVLYSPAAFQAAGLTAPKSEWTVADFETACAVIQGAAKAGRLPKPFYGPLPPLAGRSKIPMAGGGTLIWYGGLSDPGLWGAFALGFGGSVARQGRFDLTDPGAVEGIGRLVDIARRYAAPQKDVPQTEPQRTVVQQGAVMTFQLYKGLPAPKGFRYARFPQLPVRPVIPTTPQGVGLVHALGVGSWSQNYAVKAVTPEDEDHAVQYVLWSYSVARGQTQLPTLPPPPLADASLQTGYWAAPARAANGGDAVGDWRNDVVVEAEWPQTGPAGRSAPFLDRTADIVLAALTQAVFDNAPVASVLADATKQLNAAAAQYASASGGV